MTRRAPAWRRELATAGAVLLAGVGAGQLLGSPAGGVAAGLLVYLSWHFVQLIRFLRWLDGPKGRSAPVRVGIWLFAIDAVSGLKERGRKRKRKLSRMLSGFQESTDALPDATVVLDDEGRIEWWNGVAARVLGVDKKRDNGRRIDDLVTDPVFLEYLARGDYERPLQIPAPVDASASLEVRIVPYGKGKKLLQARDITRLHQLETVRRDFVANVSHEMRTPLTVVHGYLETMEDSRDERLSGWAGIISQMHQQTTRMQRIVEELLLLSRLETQEEREGQEVVDVPLLLQDLREEARKLSGDAGHRITLEVDDGLSLFGSPSELDSAFSNLIFNAVRYTPAGGAIRIGWNQGDGGPRFTVADTGIGIAAEHLPRLTERFYRVDVGRSRKSGGTGLGLAIVKHVMTRHEGRLEIESEPGKGSLFSCCFPAARARPRIGTAPQPPVPAPRRRMGATSR